MLCHYASPWGGQGEEETPSDSWQDAPRYINNCEKQRGEADM